MSLSIKKGLKNILKGKIKFIKVRTALLKLSQECAEPANSIQKAVAA